MNVKKLCNDAVVNPRSSAILVPVPVVHLSECHYLFIQIQRSILSFQTNLSDRRRK